MRLIFTITAAAVLSACGGGSAACHLVTVSLQGDSTQQGVDGASGNIVANTPAKLLQTTLDAQFGPGVVTVQDQAITGTTSAQASRSAAEVRIESFGINDLRTGMSIADYQANIKRLAPTNVETQNPLLDPQWQTGEPQFVAAAKATAGQIGADVADVNGYVRSIPNWQAMIPDGVHPTQELYAKIVSDVLAPVVVRQVAAVRCR